MTACPCHVVAHESLLVTGRRRTVDGARVFGGRPHGGRGPRAPGPRRREPRHGERERDRPAPPAAPVREPARADPHLRRSRLARRQVMDRRDHHTRDRTGQHAAGVRAGIPRHGGGQAAARGRRVTGRSPARWRAAHDRRARDRPRRRDHAVGRQSGAGRRRRARGEGFPRLASGIDGGILSRREDPGVMPRGRRIAAAFQRGVPRHLGAEAERRACSWSRRGQPRSSAASQSSWRAPTRKPLSSGACASSAIC